MYFEVLLAEHRHHFAIATFDSENRLMLQQLLDRREMAMLYHISEAALLHASSCVEILRAEERRLQSGGMRSEAL